MARYFTRLRLVKYLAISHADSCNKSYVQRGRRREGGEGEGREGRGGEGRGEGSGEEGELRETSWTLLQVLSKMPLFRTRSSKPINVQLTLYSSQRLETLS